MNLRLLALPALILAAASPARAEPAPVSGPPAPPTAPAAKSAGAEMRYKVEARSDAEQPKYTFSLLPRSMTKNPTLDMTAITEMTEAGRARPPATPDKPQYYAAVAGGFKQMGWSSPAGEKPPPQPEMESIMRRALARNGFLPADKEHPASIVLVYHWGSFARADTSDAESTNATTEVMYRELIERAMLVGGDKFAKDLAQAMEARFRLTDVQIQQRNTPNQDMPNVMGDAANSLTGGFLDPVETFMASSKTTRFLAEQADVSLYYVIASAFDAVAMAKNQKTLLWRTKMTVDSGGVSLMQTLPVLVANSSAYFGREMDQPATMVQSVRESRIELGEPEVVRYEDEPVKKPTAKKNP